MTIDAVEPESAEGEVLDDYVMDVVERDADLLTAAGKVVGIRQLASIDAQVNPALQKTALAGLKRRGLPRQRLPTRERLTVQEKLLKAHVSRAGAKGIAAREFPLGICQRNRTVERHAVSDDHCRKAIAAAVARALERDALAVWLPGIGDDDPIARLSDS